MTTTITEPCTLDQVTVYLAAGTNVTVGGEPVRAEFDYHIDEDYPYYCDGCDTEFKRWNHVREHLGIPCKHPYAYKGKCSDCGEATQVA